MKKYFFIGLLTALLLNACSEKEDPTELPPVTEESITLITGTETNFNFDSEGGNVTLPFTASAEWTAKFLSPDDKEWIQVEPSTGTAGEQNVTITAQANELTEERKASLLLECGKKSINLNAFEVGIGEYEVDEEYNSYSSVCEGIANYFESTAPGKVSTVLAVYGFADDCGADNTCYDYIGKYNPYDGESLKRL